MRPFKGAFAVGKIVDPKSNIGLIDLRDIRSSWRGDIDPKGKNPVCGHLDNVKRGALNAEGQDRVTIDVHPKLAGVAMLVAQAQLIGIPHRAIGQEHMGRIAHRFDRKVYG